MAPDRPAGPRLSRRAFLALLGAGAVAAAAGTSVAAAYRFRVERISAPLAGLRAPLSVAWLCDLHYGPFVRAGSVAAWVDAALALAPDLVFLGGDVVDHRASDDLDPLFAQLARLRAPFGVFAIRGNHEYLRFRSPAALDAYEARLAAAGIVTLVNRGVMLRDGLWLAGLDDRGVGPLSVARALDGRPPEAACLFGLHRPDVLPQVPTEVQLTLCGHTHGGQVVVPGIGPIVTRTRLGPDFVAGWVRAPALAYVSRGLGVTHVPVRVNCPAELTLATLAPA